MRDKRSLTSVILEAAAVLLVTVLAFTWGQRTAMIERGYGAIGGEYLLILLPAIYYAGKQTILDWVAYIRRRWKEDK